MLIQSVEISSCSLCELTYFFIYRGYIIIISSEECEIFLVSKLALACQVTLSEQHSVISGLNY